MSDREVTAYHEAGHAVMRWSQGRAFKQATVVPGDEYWGGVFHRPAGEWFRPDIELDGRGLRHLEDDIMASWAGPLAEAIYLDTLNSADPLPGAQADLDHIVNLALHVSGSTEEAEAYIEWLRLCALNRLRNRYWHVVEAFAAALLERGTIRWKDAKGIMQAAQDAWLHLPLN